MRFFAKNHRIYVDEISSSDLSDTEATPDIEAQKADTKVFIETLKDETYTIAIIGRPNVGKSTLFNRLMGQQLALVDRTPGLTRDRREGVTDLFGTVPVRLVDTAGFEGTKWLDDKHLIKRSLNKAMIQDMLRQTRNALIYADLALFLLDTRAGITYNDVALYKWLTQAIDKQNLIKKQSDDDGKTSKEKQAKTEVLEEDYLKIIEQQEKESAARDSSEPEEFTPITPGQIPGLEHLISEKQKRKMQQKVEAKAERTVFEKDRKLEKIDLSTAIPPIIYLANKAEDGFEGDIMADFYKMFPQVTTALDKQTGLPIEPLFVSAEHGDGLPDLMRTIKDHIPETKEKEYADRRQKRLDRFLEYKQMLVDEIVDLKKAELDANAEELLQEAKENNTQIDLQKELEEFVRAWEKEFDAVNAGVEDNSDFDSDNDINPLDSLDSLGRYYSSQQSKQQISSENTMKRKPIQLSIVGKPNVGKSTLVNALVEEQRVIANDLAGTTRDAVRVQWIYGGRRVTLVDTAGLHLNRGNHTQMDEMLQQDVFEAIKYSHVVAVVIDALEAFTAADMTLIKRVLDEGRAVVVIANKWDLVEDRYKRKAVKWMEKQLEKGLGQAKGIPIGFISAKTGQRQSKVMDEVLRVYEKWNTRVSTGLLNKWMHAFQKVQRMPSEAGRMLKMRYLMQIKTRPPTFFLFVNRKNLVTDNFEHFIRNSIAKEFGFVGSPIRILLRDNRTQYAKRKLSQLTPAAMSIINRIKAYKNRQRNVTHRRRLSGNRFLYKK